jgi:hypothetical protein
MPARCEWTDGPSAIRFFGAALLQFLPQALDLRGEEVTLFTERVELSTRYVLLAVDRDEAFARVNSLTHQATV